MKPRSSSHNMLLAIGTLLILSEKTNAGETMTGCIAGRKISTIQDSIINYNQYSALSKNISNKAEVLHSSEIGKSDDLKRKVVYIEIKSNELIETLYPRAYLVCELKTKQGDSAFAHICNLLLNSNIEQGLIDKYNRTGSLGYQLRNSRGLLEFSSSISAHETKCNGADGVEIKLYLDLVISEEYQSYAALAQIDVQQTQRDVIKFMQDLFSTVIRNGKPALK